MILWKRGFLLGLLSWFLPFAFSFVIFPLKRWNAPLFATTMMLILLVVACGAFRVYFRDKSVKMPEALLVGTLWLTCNIVLDYSLFSHGPMRMTVLAYYSEIGLAYLIYPLFGFGAAWLVQSQQCAATRI